MTNNKASAQSNVADYSNPARFYKGSDIIIEYAYEITRIVIHCVGNDKLQASDVIDGATISVTESVATIMLNSASTEFTIASLPRKIFVSSIEVYTN